MTPKEWKFVFELLSESMQRAYQRGVDDTKAGKALQDANFRVRPGSQLSIKKLFSEFMKNP